MRQCADRSLRSARAPSSSIRSEVGSSSRDGQPGRVGLGSRSQTPEKIGLHIDSVGLRYIGRFEHMRASRENT